MPAGGTGPSRDEERALWERELRGVRRLPEPRGGGRIVGAVPPKGEPLPRPPSDSFDTSPLPRPPTLGVAPAFEVHREPDGYVEAWRRGSPPEVRACVVREPLCPEARLDLHGCTTSEARRRLEHFLRRAWLSRLQLVLVVHGRGLHSPEGRASLPDFVCETLTSVPCAHWVWAFATAPRRLGGDGALVVRLHPRRRRSRKHSARR